MALSDQIGAVGGCDFDLLDAIKASLHASRRTVSIWIIWSDNHPGAGRGGALDKRSFGAVMFDSDDFSIKRVYAQASPDDGTRILVDRLWPRGIAKDKAKIDLWLKDIAPSNALRKRFHGDPDRWDEFCSAYAAELDGEVGRAAVNELIGCRKRGPVTLLYAARNEEQNNAVALKAYMVGQAKRRT